MSNLAEQLRRLRIKNKLSQEDLARILGLARSTISSYENGSRTPDIDTLTRIASYFEISLDELLGHQVEPKAQNEPEYVKVLEELIRTLSSSPLSEPSKNEIVDEIRDYFLFKLEQGKRRERKRD